MRTKAILGLALILISALYFTATHRNQLDAPSDLKDAPNSGEFRDLGVKDAQEAGGTVPEAVGKVVDQSQGFGQTAQSQPLVFESSIHYGMKGDASKAMERLTAAMTKAGVAVLDAKVVRQSYEVVYNLFDWREFTYQIRYQSDSRVGSYSPAGKYASSAQAKEDMEKGIALMDKAGLAIIDSYLQKDGFVIFYGAKPGPDPVQRMKLAGEKVDQNKLLDNFAKAGVPVLAVTKDNVVDYIGERKAEMLCATKDVPALISQREQKGAKVVWVDSGVNDATGQAYSTIYYLGGSD